MNQNKNNQMPSPSTGEKRLSAADVTQGFTTAVRALVEARHPDASSTHQSRRLNQPVETNFGQFSELLSYSGQANTLEELSPDPESPVTPVGLLFVTVEQPDGTKRTVQIGARSNAEQVLERFAQKYGDADGDYVMFIDDPGAATMVPPIVLRSENMPTVIRPGESITFKQDGKVKQVGGIVRGINGLRS